MPNLCPWPRNILTYDGLYTHFSINERLAIDSITYLRTPEEINKVDLERKQAKNRQYIANKDEGGYAARCAAIRDKALEAQT